jgi:hypothetical protein
VGGRGRKHQLKTYKTVCQFFLWGLGHKFYERKVCSIEVWLLLKENKLVGVHDRKFFETRFYCTATSLLHNN